MAPSSVRHWYDGAPLLVGRQAEMGTLAGAWEAAFTGQPQTVVLVGDPGSGKTRLVQEVCRSLGDRAEVLRGACLQDAPVAYEPFVEPVTSLASRATPEDPLPLRLGWLDLASAGVGLTDEVYQAVADLIAAASRVRPIVLVVEDIHWATQTTLGMLAWLVHRLRGCPVLLLVTTRGAPPDSREVTSGTLEALAREPGVTRVSLTGLDRAEVLAFLRAQHLASGPRPDLLAKHLHDQTGGNPFLLHEVCRDIRVRGYDPANPTAPASLRDLIAVRLAALRSPEREVVELAAVLGEQVSVGLLEQHATPSVALTALQRAIDSGLMVSLPDGSYRFVHALGRQAVLDLLPGVRRAWLHGRAVDLLQPLLGGSMAEVAQLAHHCLNAGRREAGLLHLKRAGGIAAESLAWKEAGDIYRRVADLSVAPDERHHYQMLAARCYQTADDTITGTYLAKQVAIETADAATRLEAATLRERNSTLDRGDFESIVMLAQALGDYPEVLDSQVLRAIGSLSRGLAQVGDNRDFADSQRLRVALLAHARRSAQRGGADWEGLADALEVGLPRAFGRPWLAAAVAAEAQELSALVRDRGNVHFHGAAGFFQALLGLRTGDLQLQRAAIADFERAIDCGYPVFDFWPTIVDAGRRFQRGDFGGAEAAVAHAAELVRTRWDVRGFGYEGLQLFLIRRESGQLGRVGELLTGRQELRDCWAPGLLALYVAAGMRAPAATLLARLARDDVLALNDRTEYLPTTLAFMVEAALFLSDAATLRRLRPLLAGHSGLNLVSEQFVALHGSADRYLGMIDSQLGQGDPLASFAVAAELDRRSDAPVHLGLTLAARAAHLAGIRGPGDSAVRSAIADARAVAEPIGHVRVLKAMDRLTGAVRSAVAPSRLVDSGGLTARELEVLALIVAGASNAQIARQLFISQNTAANHVRSILAKLGAENRTQAAMLAVSRGLVAAP